MPADRFRFREMTFSRACSWQTVRRPDLTDLLLIGSRSKRSRNSCQYTSLPSSEPGNCSVAFSWIIARYIQSGSSAGGTTPSCPSSSSCPSTSNRSEEHTSELQSLRHLVCRLLLEK